jgi:hypothetical protein
MIRIDVLGDYHHVTYPLVSQKKAAQGRPVHTMRLNLVNSVLVSAVPKVRVARILGIPVQGPSLFERLRGKS